MIKPEQIPEAVVSAAFLKFVRYKSGSTRDAFAAAVAAAINDWPGAVKFTPHAAAWPEVPSIVLPLPEKGEK